ncbi:MAG: hypothetical protein AAFU61_14785, partial [Pseudomonadota bacterium]
PSSVSTSLPEESTLRNLTLTGGYTYQDAPGDVRPGYPDYWKYRYNGAGLYTDEGNVNIRDGAVSGNGIYIGENGQFGSGGAGIYAEQAFNPFEANPELNILRILNSSIEGNHIEGVLRERVGGVNAGEEYVFAGMGGGVLARFAQINSSTIANNSTNGDGSGFGGGLALTYDASIVNSTIYGNVITGTDGRGGGIYAPSRLEIINSTVVANRAEGEGSEGGGFSAWGVVLDDSVGNDVKRIANSIFLGNFAEGSETHDVAFSIWEESRFGVHDENVIEGLNIIGEYTNPRPELTDFQGSIISRAPTAVLENGGELKDNGGDVKSVKLRASPLNPAIDGSQGAAVPEDTTGRPAQDWPGQGNDNDLPGIRDVGAYELPLLTGGLEELVEGTDGADRLKGTNREETFLLNGGADTVVGTLAGLDGDRIEGFGFDDAITVRRARFDTNDMAFRLGSLIVEVDAAGGPAPEATFRLVGDFSGRILLAEDDGRNTELTLANLALGRNAGETFRGTNKRDFIDGRKGGDAIRGRGGDDQLNGGKGKDRVDGGAGDDLIEGGAQSDLLTGGSGRDAFIFVRGSGRDRITDFDVRRDTLDYTSHSAVKAFADLR